MNAMQRLAAMIACFALGIVVCGVATVNHATTKPTLTGGDKFDLDNPDRTNPDSTLGIEQDSRWIDVRIVSQALLPDEVVSLQLKSLRESLADPTRLAVCYSLASPKNRQLTGPFTRFAAMVMQPPYDQLARCTSWQIGSASIENDYAAVLVSTINGREKPQAFRFLLHRHSQAPYEGCWLTDAVQALQPLRELQPGAAQSIEELKID